MSFQLNLFGTTALADTQNDLFWGELEGEDGAPPRPARHTGRDGPSQDRLSYGGRPRPR